MAQEKLNTCLKRINDNGGFIDEEHKKEYEELVSNLYKTKITADYIPVKSSKNKTNDQE